MSKQQPAIVQITIENLSDKDISFSSEYIFDLQTLESNSGNLERLGDRYYSRSGIASKNRQLRLIPKDLNKMVTINRTTSRFVNEEVHLSKGATIQIDADLTKLLWADRMSSFWPSDQFAKLIPKGEYLLWFEIHGDEVNAVSNKVDLEIP